MVVGTERTSTILSVVSYVRLVSIDNGCVESSISTTVIAVPLAMSSLNGMATTEVVDARVAVSDGCLTNCDCICLAVLMHSNVVVDHVVAVTIVSVVVGMDGCIATVSIVEENGKKDVSSVIAMGNPAKRSGQVSVSGGEATI